MPSVELQVKEGFDKIQNEFDNFKKENDARLARIEKNGHVPADIESKIAKQNEAIDALVEKLEKTQTALNRTATATTPEVEAKAVEKKMSAFMNTYMKRGDQRLTAEQVKFYNDNLPQEYKSLTVGNDIEGGYFVRPEVSNEITKKLFESSPVRQYAGVINISSDAFEEPYDADEPDASWVGEVASRAETDENNVGMLRINTHELYANPAASQKLLEDSSVDVEAWHAAKVVEKFARTEAVAFVTGNGVAKPKGFCSYASGTSWGQIEQISSGTSAAVTADGLIALQMALFEPYQANARFMAARGTCLEIRKLKDGEGRYLWSMDGNLQDGYQQMLLGRPMHWASDMAAVAADSLSVAYGDFKQGYLIVDRVGISVLRDPYSNKPFVHFYTRKRVGGGVRNFQAIKLLKLAA